LSAAARSVVGIVERTKHGTIGVVRDKMEITVVEVAGREDVYRQDSIEECNDDNPDEDNVGNSSNSSDMFDNCADFKRFSIWMNTQPKLGMGKLAPMFLCMYFKKAAR
jgi:hypothetical protein